MSSSFSKKQQQDSTLKTPTSTTTSSKPLTGLQIFIFLLCIAIFILFVVILSLSVHQFMYYKTTQGTVLCQHLTSRCILSFNYYDSSGNEHSKLSPIGYDEIGQDGVFTVQVAYHYNKNDNDLHDFFIIGSNYHMFLGTQNLIIIYSILSFISLLVCLTFFPILSSSSKEEKKHK